MDIYQKKKMVRLFKTGICFQKKLIAYAKHCASGSLYLKFRPHIAAMENARMIIKKSNTDSRIISIPGDHDIPYQNILLPVLLRLSIAISSALMLESCGGGSVLATTTSSDSDSADSTDDTSDTTETGISYYPLAFLHVGMDEYYGASSDVFIVDADTPFIYNYIIVPVDSRTLESVDTATVSDFSMTVDDVAIDSEESHPLLQKLLGYEVTLTTAIVIDTSASMDVASKNTLISEVKNFISSAKASSNSTIANQQFTIWAFGDASHVVNITGGFSSDTNTLNANLDTLATNWSASIYGRSSALYQAVVAAIGSYVGDGSYNDNGGGAYDFLSDDYPDLYESTTIDGIRMADVVVVSAGANTVGGFDADALETAITWQSLITYDTDSDDYSSSQLGKALYYVALEGDTDETLEGLADTTLTASLSNNTYNFASDLVNAQLAGINARTASSGNRYVYRYAFLPRNGEHSTSFASQTAYYSYSLSADIDLSDGSSASVGTAEEELPSLVEITGANNEYLANNKASLAEITTLYPATRWVTSNYDSSSYSWTVGGSNRTANSAGAITISVADIGKTVILTNTVLGQTTELIIEE
jgi:hypothetical protein